MRADEPPGAAVVGTSPYGALCAPGLDDFAQLARSAFDALPEALRTAAGDVVFRIEDFADEETLAEMEIEDPFELTGLYRGEGFGRHASLEPPTGPAIVFLYRRPILDEWAERGDETLGSLIAHVLVHEIGHHFGLDDDDIDRLLA